MTSNPRDMQGWMRQVERQLTQARGMPGLIQSAGEVIRGEIVEEAQRQPTAPIELVYQTGTYMTVEGAWRGRFILDFPDVTKGTDGSDVTVIFYELEGKDTTQTPAEAMTAAVPGLALPGYTYAGLAVDDIVPAEKLWKQMATSLTSGFRIEDLAPGSTWEFRARALGRNSVQAGLWSEVVEVQILRDTTPPGQTTAPDVSVRRGTITVSWDGMGVNGQMPADFRYAELAHGTSSSPTQIVAYFDRRGGFTIISDIPYYDPQFFRLRAVDESGNKGPWSEQATGYTTPLVDVDVILSEIDGAKTYLHNIDAGVAILPNTILTEHLVVTEEMTAAIANFLHVNADMILANAVEADKIAAGAVSAVKLEAVLALVTKIIAGDPLGTHVELTPEGLRVFAQDLTGDGVPDEVVRLGVAETDDYLAITRADGTMAASISQDGVIVGKSIEATETLYYKGRELTDLLEERPRGLAAYGDRYTGLTGITSEYGIFDVHFTAYPGRAYEITLFADISGENNGGAVHVLRTADDGATPTLTSTEIKRFEQDFPADSAPSWTQTFLWYPQIEVQTDKRVLWSVAKFGTGTATWHGGEMVIKDVGFRRVTVGTQNNGGGSTAAPVTVREKTWTAVDRRSYNGANALYTNDPNRMYQGLSPAGYGELRSMAFFPDMTADLSGAVINEMRAYIYFDHWYYNAGGTAVIGVHGHTGAPPSTFNWIGEIAESPGWPKPGGRWVNIPSIYWDNFKTGAYRGLTLGVNTSGYQFYGIANGSPQIYAKYTK